MGGEGSKESKSRIFSELFSGGGASVQGKERDGWRRGVDGGEGWMEERGEWRRGMDGGQGWMEDRDRWRSQSNNFQK